MKKLNLIWFLVAAMFITACTVSDDSPDSEKGFGVLQISADLKNVQPANSPESQANVARHTYLFEKECNGHIYVICTGSGTQSGVFMLHSPNCPCMNHEGESFGY